MESLHDYVSFSCDLNTCRLQCASRRSSICYEEMCNAAPMHHPSSTSFDTDSGATQRFPHVGQCARPVL